MTTECPQCRALRLDLYAATERLMALQDTLRKIRQRQPWSLNEARTKAALAQRDLEAAREVIDRLAVEHATTRRHLDALAAENAALRSRP